MVDEEEWTALRACRDQINKCIETARNDKTIGATLEAKVVVHTADPCLRAALEKYADGEGGNGVDEARLLFLTSQVELVDDAELVASRCSHSLSATEPVPLTVGVTAADGIKCERCWLYSPTVAESGDSEYPGVCSRCAASLKLMEFPAVSPPAPEAEPAVL